MSARSAISRAGRSVPLAACRVALVTAFACAGLVVPLRSGQAQEPPPPAPSALAPCGSGTNALEVVLLPQPAALLASHLDRDAPAGAPPDSPASAARLDVALRAAICYWFQDDRWRVAFTPRRRMPEPGSVQHLRLSLELASPASARLYADTARGRSVHEVPLEKGLDDAGIEAIAEALHSTAQAASAASEPRRPSSHSSSAAMAGAGKAGPPAATITPAPRSSPPPPAPALAPAAGGDLASDAPRPGATRDAAPAARAPARGRRFPLHTALGYQAYARGPEPVMHGPALHVELDAFEHPVVLAAWFRAAAFLSGTARSSGFAVRSSGASLSVGAAASLPIGAVTARAGAGAGVDRVALDVRVLDPTLVRSLPDRRVAPRPFSGLEAGVRWRAGSMELAADALLRFLWRDTPYQVRDGERTLTVFSPWQLQPGALLGLGYVW
jgi:hypothetical protein